MATYTGFVDGTGGINAHEKFLDVLQQKGEANGWTTLRSGLSPDSGPDPTTRRKELIMRGVGLSGTEQIFAGFRTYQNPNADYYNMSIAGMMGFVSANLWSLQPQMYESGIPLHNNRIDYWINVNAQRFLFAAKVGTPVYVMGHTGKFFPIASPQQYPDPLFCGGMFVNGAEARRFDSTNYFFPWFGRLSSAGDDPTGARVRRMDGTWFKPSFPDWVAPIRSQSFTVAARMRETLGQYPLSRLTLCDWIANTTTPVSNEFGWIDGVYRIPGFNNAVENTVTIAGKTYLVMQSVNNTSNDYYVAMDITP